jgi:transposase
MPLWQRLRRHLASGQIDAQTGTERAVVDRATTNIARLHGISTGQLYTWRHALRAAQPDAAFGRFARVEVAPQPVARVDIPARPPGLIEIALSDGTTVRVDAGIDPRALRRVLTALRG